MNREQLEKLLRQAQADHYKVITSELEASETPDETAEPITDRSPSDYVPSAIVLDFIVAQKQLKLHTHDLQSVTIGRSSSAAQVYDGLDLASYGAFEYGLSRQHATLSIEQGNIILRDLKSLNGTFLNGMRLHAGSDYILRDGDTIRFGLLAVKLSFVR